MKKEAGELTDCIVMKFDMDSPEWKARMEKIRRDKEHKGEVADKDVLYRKNG